MKKAALLAVFAILVAGVSGNIWAYEGGTKVIATMTHPEQGKMVAGPLVLVPYSQLNPGKLIERYLHRMPEPTLSAERIREEKPGPSLGTKIHVRYLKRGRV